MTSTIALLDLVLAAMLAVPQTSAAQCTEPYWQYCHEYPNTTGQTANDFRLTLRGSFWACAVNVCDQAPRWRMSDGTQFGPATITNNGTSEVRLDWVTPAIAPGDRIHVSYKATRTCAAEALDAVWTHNGSPSDSTRPAVPELWGPATRVFVVRLTEYRWPFNDKYAIHFLQGQGTSVRVIPPFTGIVYARLAVLEVGTPVPDDSLSSDNTALMLQLDAVEGPLLPYTAPNLPALNRWGLALLFAVLLVLSVWVLRKRQRLQAA